MSEAKKVLIIQWPVFFLFFLCLYPKVLVSNLWIPTHSGRKFYLISTLFEAFIECYIVLSSVWKNFPNTSKK